jgi:ion channel-forming bestrophin family protein
MISKNFHWLKLAFQLKGSILSIIYKKVISYGIFGFFISLLYYLKLPVSQPIFESVIPSIVLGLLLVFRTNTAYDRFWEGRKCWGSMVNNTRNLARQILVSIDEITPEDKNNKIATLYLLVAFSVATKLHLRGEPVNSELEELMGHSRYLKLKTLNNPPLKIAFWIGDYLERQYKRNCLSNYQLIAIQELLNNLVDSLGACERILKTPIPLAYAIHLKQLLLIYCFLLPFQLVQSLGWWTGLITALVSFTLFGIEAIGLEIENPFGRDENDLQLETICNTMKRNMDDLINFNPYVRSHHENINN